MNWKKMYHVYRQLVNGKPLSFGQFLKEKEKSIYLDKWVSIRFRKNQIISFEIDRMNSHAFKQSGKVSHYEQFLLKEAKRVGLPVLTYKGKNRFDQKNIAKELQANSEEGEKIKSLLEKHDIQLNTYYVAQEEFSVDFPHLKNMQVSWNIGKSRYRIGSTIFSSIEDFEKGFLHFQEVSTRIGICQQVLAQKAKALDPAFCFKQNRLYYGKFYVPFYVDVAFDKNGKEQYRGFLGKQEEVKAFSLREFQEKIENQLIPCYHTLRLRQIFI